MEQTLNQPSIQDANTPAPQQTDGNLVAANAEIEKQMQVALNGYQQFPEQAQQASTTPAPASGSDEYETVDIDSYLKNYGFDSEDAFKQQLEAWKQAQATPPQAQPYNFSNDESRLLVEAINAGKRDDVISILNKQAQIERLISSEVNKDTAPEIVKLGMQLKYKDLTPDEINYKFNKQYGIPPRPTQSDLETDEEYSEKVNAWQGIVNDKQMELMIEAKLARPEIETSKSNIQLPKIESQVDEEYLAWKQQQEKRQSATQEATDHYKAFTPKTIETKMNFIDEANKINFEFQFEPDSDSFKEAMEMTSDLNKFFAHFYNSDGSPNRTEYARALYMALNYKKIIPEAIRQGSNARFKALLPDNSVDNGGKQFVGGQDELSEFQKQMKQALAGYV